MPLIDIGRLIKNKRPERGPRPGSSGRAHSLEPRAAFGLLTLDTPQSRSRQTAAQTSFGHGLVHGLFFDSRSALHARMINTHAIYPTDAIGPRCS